MKFSYLDLITGNNLDDFVHKGMLEVFVKSIGKVTHLQYYF